jgi:hypothetical protein
MESRGKSVYCHDFFFKRLWISRSTSTWQSNDPIVPLAVPTEFIEIRWHEGSGWQVRISKKSDVKELQTANTIYTVSEEEYEAHVEQQKWQKLYQNPDGRLNTTSGSEGDVFLRLQPDSSWNSTTDDVIKLLSTEGSTVPERATLYRLKRAYDEATSALRFEGQYTEVAGDENVFLGSVRPKLSLAGFWGRSETGDVSSILPSCLKRLWILRSTSQSWQTSITTPVPVAVPINLIEIRWHQGPRGEWSGWQVRFLRKAEAKGMLRQTAKTIYTLSKEEHEAYVEQQKWQKLYRNPDKRLKTTNSRREGYVYLRLQEDPSPWNLMTDDVIKLLSTEGSTVPERVTTYRLERSYNDETSLLRFDIQSKQYKEGLWKDAPLDRSYRPNLPLYGFWGRSKIRAVSILSSFLKR